MSNWESICAEMQDLNLHLTAEVKRRCRGGSPQALDQLQGLVLHQDDILRILSESWPASSDAAALGDPQTEAAELFHLSRAEELCLLLCLAAEMDSQYGKVFAFIHDDVTRKQPSVGLALDLFWGKEKFPEGRPVFLPGAPLLRHRLLEISEHSHGPTTFPQRTLRLDTRIAGLLLGTGEIDGALNGWVETVLPGDEPVRTPVRADICERTLRLAASCFAEGEAPVRPVFHLYGRPGAGHKSVAQYVCGQLGLPLLLADFRRLPSGAGRVDALWRLGREALLQPAAVFLEYFDDLLDDGQREERNSLLDSLGEYAPLTFLSGIKPWNPPLEIKRRLFIAVECPGGDAGARVPLWTEHLGQTAHTLSEDEVREVAIEFNFTDGQIREAMLTARSQALWKGQPPEALSAAAVYASCRIQATPNLGDMARRVEPTGHWDDLVLPDPQKEQLREIVTQVKRSQTVLEQWGFGNKFPYGCGMTALFEGASGTGKTMAAGIIAGNLGLDLYKIDLATVVNKYIGETEKNLSRAFEEAADSNTILFFDEAEALFAKRSETVKDANDRYAGIETAHLLQRIENHAGVVILATNMRQNLDEAFVRRMRFIIHFPFPSDDDREQIWRGIFPAQTPIVQELDFRWLARKLKLTAGHIKNIALRAAFLALDRTGVVTMDCILDAARREVEKIGKAYNPADFRGRGVRTEDPAAVEVA